MLQVCFAANSFAAGSYESSRDELEDDSAFSHRLKRGVSDGLIR
jgi:hypothetical protein